MNHVIPFIIDLLISLLIVSPIFYVKYTQALCSYLLRKNIDNIDKIKIRNFHILSNIKKYIVASLISFALFVGYIVIGILLINKNFDRVLDIGDIISFSIMSVCILGFIIYIVCLTLIALKYKKNITNLDWKIDLKKIDDAIKTIYGISIVEHNINNPELKMKLKIEKIKQKYNLNNQPDQILFFFDLYENLCLYFFKIEKRENQIKINDQVTNLSFYKVDFFKSLNETINW